MVNDRNLPDRHLPATEFDLMKLIWSAGGEVTTTYLMERYGNERGWKTPTLITLLNRLIARGMLKSEKNGRERLYTPLVSEREYMMEELSEVADRYSGRLAELMCALAASPLSDDDADELEKWLDEKAAKRGTKK